MKRLFLAFLLAVSLQAAAPLIFWVDQTSGATTGGENNNGTYLTIGGNNFGSSQGTSSVAINGIAVAQVLTWSNVQIGVQVGSVTTGAITVTVGGSTATGPTWTARTGHIYFVGPGVDNSVPTSTCATALASHVYPTGGGGTTFDGSYAHPFGLQNSVTSTTEVGPYSYTNTYTPFTYYRCLVAGDTLVFLNGVSYPYYDGRGWHASLTIGDVSGTATNPVTIMGRPGGTATLGGGLSGGTSAYGIRADGATGVWLVVSGLYANGANQPKGCTGNACSSAGAGIALGDMKNLRVVNNDVQCAYCDQSASAIDHPGGNSVVFGNQVHNVSTNMSPGSSKTFHAMYAACCNDGTPIEFGWNHIYNTRAYNGIQIHDDSQQASLHPPGGGFYNISIHDNQISDISGCGVNLSTIVPNLGYVKVFNNVVSHVGLGLEAGRSATDPHCGFSYKAYGLTTATGTVQIYNNSFYDTGSALNSISENSDCGIYDQGNQPGVTRLYTNNIISQLSYTNTSLQNVYICGGITNAQQLTLMAGSSNNIFYSLGTPGSTLQAATFGTITDPQYTSPATGDLTLQSSSPALAGGTAVLESIADFAGIVRPSPPSVGAYEASTCQINGFPSAHIGSSYSVTVPSASCPSPSTSITSGSLPGWASLSGNVVSGMPSGTSPSTSTFTVSVTSTNGNPSSTESLTTCTLPVITTTSPLPSGFVASPYSITFGATGDSPITWTGILPGGASISSSGVFTWTPTLPNVYNLTITATNACGFQQVSPIQLVVSSSAAGPGVTVTLGNVVNVGSVVTF